MKMFSNIYFFIGSLHNFVGAVNWGNLGQDELVKMLPHLGEFEDTWS